MDDKNSWFDVTGTGTMRVAIIGTLGILSLFLLAETIEQSQTIAHPASLANDTITVNGDGTATVPPDVAHISFSVQNTAASVAGAQSATTKQANDVISYLTGAGIADKDVRTLSYDITPQYAQKNVVVPAACAPGAACSTPVYGNSSVVVGYQVSETVQITVRTLADVGTILQGLGTRGVQNVSGPDFALDDPTAGYDAARTDAIAKAQAQAATIAKSLGVSLGRITNFSESSGGYPVPMYGVALAAGRDASVPSLPTGENTYTSSVSITYEIQ